MAIIGITLGAQQSYESDLDPDKGTEKATRFQIGTLDSRIIGRMKDESTSFGVNPTAPDDEVDVSVGQNQLHYKACKFGLKGWSNLQDASGNDIVFKTNRKNYAGGTYDVVMDDVLARVPSEVLSEVGAKILAMNEVTPAEAGK